MRFLQVTVAMGIGLAGCSRSESDASSAVLNVAPDANALIELTEHDLVAVRKKAQSGDPAAAEALYHHYLAKGDDWQADTWETWLIDRGNAAATGRRAELRFEEAAKLPDDDPRKLALLKEAIELNARLPGLTATERVMVNGRIVDITAERKESRARFETELKQEFRRVYARQNH